MHLHTDNYILEIIIVVFPRNLEEGIWSLLTPVIMLLGGSYVAGHIWRWVICTFLRTFLFQCDLHRDNLCMGDLSPREKKELTPKKITCDDIKTAATDSPLKFPWVFHKY